MNKIVLAFVGYVFLVLLMFSVIVVVIDRGHVRKITDTYTESILEDRTRLVEGWLEERTKDVEILALTQEVGTMDPELALPLLRAAIEKHSELYARYYIIDLDGQMTDTLGIRSLESGRFDFSDKEEKIIVTKPVKDPTFKQPTIELYVPVMDEGKVVGILGATVLLYDLNDLVSAGPVYGKGTEPDRCIP